jgi:hypothetical protein
MIVLLFKLPQIVQIYLINCVVERYYHDIGGELVVKCVNAAKS